MTDWRWVHFPRQEMQCKCGCGRCEMNPAFMDRLEVIRAKLNKPMPVTSGYRCPEHNARESDTGLAGPHTKGRAVDIAISGGHALILMYEAVAAGCTGVGVKQHGPREKRFVHIDDLVDGFPRPNAWSYP